MNNKKQSKKSSYNCIKQIVRNIINKRNTSIIHFKLYNIERNQRKPKGIERHLVFIDWKTFMINILIL